MQIEASLPQGWNFFSRCLAKAQKLSTPLMWLLARVNSLSQFWMRWWFFSGSDRPGRRRGANRHCGWPIPRQLLARMTPCRTIWAKTDLSRSWSPKTVVLRETRRPRLPRTRWGPKVTFVHFQRLHRYVFVPQKDEPCVYGSGWSGGLLKNFSANA